MLDFRDLFWQFGRRDLTLRYRQTLLGVGWVVIQPLLAAAALAFVFGRVAKIQSPTRVPYFLLVFVGLLLWNAFSAAVTRASQSVLGNAQLVGKIYFPRMLIPLSSILSTLIDFSVTAALLLALMPLFDVQITWRVLTLPIWLSGTLLLAFGFGVVTSALTVRFRDIQYVLPVALQLLLFLSPVAYPISAVPARYQVWVLANPLTPLLSAFRWAVFGGADVSWSVLCVAMLVSVTVAVIGGLIFTRLERDFADVV